MPIISKIGARSWKVRMIYGTIFVVLIIGALTMLYPFSLMLAGSVKSQADIEDISPWPAYWTNDLSLFQKYAESKYGGVNIQYIGQAWWEKQTSFREIEAPMPENIDHELLDDFLAWRREFDMPLEWYYVGHASTVTILGRNGREFRNMMIEQFNGDINAFSRKMAIPARSWNTVVPPSDSMGYSRRYAPELKGVEIPFRKQFKPSRPLRDRAIFNLDGLFWNLYLQPLYSNEIREYNDRHGTHWKTYRQVFLTRRAPESGLARKDWENFVRDELNGHFIRLDAGLVGAFRKYLSHHYGKIKLLNNEYGTDYKSFDEVHFTTEAPDTMMALVDWLNFIKNREFCPLNGIEIYGPRQAFEEFVARRRGMAIENVRPLVMPIKQADYHDMLANTSAIRWEFTTRNYRQVLNYLVLHGRGVLNTIVYCTLAIVTALLVNPLAAYGLSRYNPPSTYKVILFCMATMAFPPAVAMIPAFLLLKRFPLWPLLGAGITFFVGAWLLGKLVPRLSETLRLAISLGLAIFAGVWFVPTVMGLRTVSLLNTFAALVLPGMANGYFIFLLKGFFDSLPRELYEAADIDGASEFVKFWSITMNLSKPILAVIALGAFNAAYSNFMMALIIIPDRKMWTLMVWIFDLQNRSHQSVVYASLVIAAIPTFIVFLFAQNIIIRGIVVPVEK